jgi:preprotein translocase subunit SecD
MAGRRMLDRWLGPLAIAASCCGLFGCGHEPTSIILEYKVDQDTMPGEIVVETDYLVAAVNSRLGKAGQARMSGNGHIEVALFGELNQSELNMIERRINTMGVLEFRITASRNIVSHRDIIERAVELPPGENELWQREYKVAEWVPYSVEEFGPVDNEDPRLVKRLAGTLPQALVLTNDGLDVTGEYLNRVSSESDERGRPQVSFYFDARGAVKFGQLTGKHIPTASGQEYLLGILLDKRLLSAPSIQSKITSQGRITGLMGQEEVDFIVAILNSGSLPYPIRQVSKKSVAERK